MLGFVISIFITQIKGEYMHKRCKNHYKYTEPIFPIEIHIWCNVILIRLINSYDSIENKKCEWEPIMNKCKSDFIVFEFDKSS